MRCRRQADWCGLALALVCVLCASSLSGGSASAAGSASAGGEGLPLLASSGTVEPAPARTLLGGFSDSVVAEVTAPTAIAFTPDGRMLVTGKAGRVVVFEEDGSRTVALNIAARVCDQIERGMVGIAVDPRFRKNRFVYLYYTHEVRGSCGGSGSGSDPANRVSRFVLGEDGRMDPRTETVIVDHITSPEAHHLAGDLEFGADGYLYISVGDGVCSLRRRSVCGPLNDNSQRLRYPHGKILRVTRGGRPPAGNPYVGRDGARRCTRPAGVAPGSGPCKEIYASGLRNPFRFARKPGTSRFFVNDVGMDTWEEVNRLRKGRNYGWNAREGHCRRASTTDCGSAHRYTDPLHDYLHGACRSVTGGAFVPVGVWPGFGNSYLFADYACGRIFQLARQPGRGWVRKVFLTGADGPVHLRFGPHGTTTALYYLSFFSNTVHRVAFSRVNTPPVAEATAIPDGTTVSFFGEGSYDPDSGDTIASWAWSYGDGTSQVTTTPTIEHTYAEAGDYRARLVVTDSRGAQSRPLALTVHAGEHPPAIELTRPGPDARFAVGRRLVLAAEATDPEDGPLSGTSLTWRIRLRHGNHFHPYLGPVPGSTVATEYPSPENLSAAATSWLVATVTATDSRGHTTVARRRLLPRTTQLRFRTAPARGDVVLEGQRLNTPLTVTSWAGYAFTVRAPNQRIEGAHHTFAGWSDNGARKHIVVTPREPTTYTASFRRD